VDSLKLIFFLIGEIIAFLVKNNVKTNARLGTVTAMKFLNIPWGGWVREREKNRQMSLGEKI
jgi:hypothetical protein